MRRLPLVALLALVLLAFAAPAHAGCGDPIRDEFLQSGAITGSHPAACYQDALENLPADVREYTDAEDVIRAAMARDAATDTSAAAVAGTTGAAAIVPASDGGDDDGIPAAVLVLAAVSLVLVILGIAGVVMRRARRS